MAGHQATYPSRIEPTWAHVRDRAPPLYMMPHQWQPPSVPPNPYHSSHCDRVQAGWRKWGADYPDWYARRAESTHPDWYTRRCDVIRGGSTTELLWPWGLTSKPTQARMLGFRDPVKPELRGNYVATPHDVWGQVEVPRWGQYHPHHYEAPGRCEPLPPLHFDEKHN